MLTYQDCLDLANLSDAEVDAIAAHEHVPAMVALEYGRYLCESREGTRCLSRMILDDIDAARVAGDPVRAAILRLALVHFVRTHPSATEPADRFVPDGGLPA